MKPRASLVKLAVPFLLGLLGLLGLLTADSFAQTAPEVPLPRQLDPTGFNQILAVVGDDLYIAGQPTADGFHRLSEAGVTTVVNLRTTMEMNNRETVPFDEAALLKELGIRYVHVPSGGPDTPYSPEMVDAFARSLDEAEGKVLLHCTVAWRASHLYAAYLTRYRSMALSEAVAHGQAINLGHLPLEGFLGERLSFEVSD